MVYELPSLPLGTSDLFRSFHRESDYHARRMLMETDLLPSGCAIELKVAKSDVFDQDRVNLPKAMAMSIDKVWGVVVSLKEETANPSANTNSPASAQILIRLPFWDQALYGYRSFFARVTAFFADFAPRQPDNLAWTVTRGDVVCGLLQRPKYPTFASF